jgi:hypothetical protein
MFIKTGEKNFAVRSRVELLDFLRGVSGKGGELKDDVSLFVPITLTNAADRGTAWTLSTFDLDRYDERVDPLGWELDSYKKNPVVQWAHRYDIPAIGRMAEVATDENGLHGSVFFNDKDYDAFGWGIGCRVRNGIIRAGSVGFRPLVIEIPGKAESADGTSLIFRRQELLEFSICNVPANPFALSGYSELAVNEAAPALAGGYFPALCAARR